VLFGALGDLHGDFDSVDRIQRRHPEVPFWLCVGDVAAARDEYRSPPSPLYWIKGNNEDFSLLADLQAGAATLRNLHYIPNGVRVLVDGVAVAGLGGTFAPTWYETPAADLPHPSGAGGRRAASRPGKASTSDKRRHFVREEVDACRRLDAVDVFLSHEAPRPFLVRPGLDAGKTPVNDILTTLAPRLHLFGHHHRFAELNVRGVRSVCLDLVSVSYLLVDGRTFEYERRTT
jgi:hypothetical protein